MIGRATLGTIAAAAAVTYALRAGGLLLAGRLPRGGPVRRAMEALPGAILVSLVAPSALKSGPAGLAAVALTAWLTLRTRNVFVAMAAGMAVVVVARRFGG
ncbi:AzlD family protein [Deferrisoma camini]|uniref:AzlD family protein n=1 Tax=Deferrisoma camini TaxID=1035120 RepID=UPI00046D8EB6|nr:AzlD domain-containing protein [Deferrisoma camini]